MDTTAWADIDDVMGKWRQGDVASVVWTGWFGTPASPLTREMSKALEQDDSRGTVLVHAEAEGLVVITQTCDIVRSCVDRPFLQLSPLVRLDRALAVQARHGRLPRYAHVSALGEDAFADLDRVLTAEKGLVADWSRIPGLTNDREQRRFAASVGRKFARFAFPDDLSRSLRGLVDRVKEKHGKATMEGQALEVLEEIRVTGTPSWSANAIDVFIVFAPPTRERAEAVTSEEEWDTLVDGWLARCTPRGKIHSIDGAMVSLDELPARDYVDSDPLDLDHLSD